MLPQHKLELTVVLTNVLRATRWQSLQLHLEKLERMVIVDPKFVARSERLLLRPLLAEDAEDVLLMRRHPEVMKHT